MIQDFAVRRYANSVEGFASREAEKVQQGEENSEKHGNGNDVVLVNRCSDLSVEGPVVILSSYKVAAATFSAPL